jgi:hypothetical protein
VLPLTEALSQTFNSYVGEFESELELTFEFTFEFEFEFTFEFKFNMWRAITFAYVNLARVNDRRTQYIKAANYLRER